MGQLPASRRQRNSPAAESHAHAGRRIATRHRLRSRDARLVLEPDRLVHKEEQVDVSYDAVASRDAVYFVQVLHDGGTAATSIALNLGTGGAVLVRNDLVEGSERTDLQQALYAGVVTGSSAALPELSAELVGKRAYAEYADGHTAEHIYVNPRRFAWQGLGKFDYSGSECDHSTTWKLDDGLFLLTWVEEWQAVGAVLLMDFTALRNVGVLFGKDDSGLVHTLCGARLALLGEINYPEGYEPAGVASSSDKEVTRPMVERARTGRRARLIVLGAALVAALALIAVGGAVARSGAAATSSSGGTATIALQADTINYIFPVMSSQYVNSANLAPFQDLMWRPLYWWDGSPYKVNAQRSLANPPVFKNHDKDVVITLKRNWKFSNGERLSPKNVALFLGMLQTDRTNFWMYLPGAFPDTLASVTYNNSADSFTLHLKKSVNPIWFLQNQLTMISPLPTAWDLKGQGTKAKCESETASVQTKKYQLVYKYLAKQAADTSTYATNPLWQIVDGPFKISKFTSGGTSATLVPNTEYSGSPKPRISQLVLDVATSDAAEYNLLKSHALTIGYVPFQSAPVKPAGAALPPTNPVPGYTFERPIATWSYNDLFWNYNNPTFGPLVRQLYFRQAMQSLIDQKGDIAAALRGYGHVDFEPTHRSRRIHSRRRMSRVSPTPSASAPHASTSRRMAGMSRRTERQRAFTPAPEPGSAARGSRRGRRCRRSSFSTQPGVRRGSSR